MLYSNPKILGFLIARLSRRSTGAGLFFLEVYVFVTSICFTWSPYDLFNGWLPEGKGTLHLHTWQHYTVSLVFWFRRTSNPSPVLPRSQMPLWLGGRAGFLGLGGPYRPWISNVNRMVVASQVCLFEGKIPIEFTWIFVSLLDHHLVSHSSLVVNLLFSSAKRSWHRGFYWNPQ